MAGPLLQVQEALAAWHAGLKTWAADVDVTLPKALQDGLPEEAGAPRHTTVLFGEHAGEPLWTRWRDIPGTAARDILQQMVATQADCHMASVEMQRELQDSAPSPEDKAALANVLEDNLTHAAALGGLLIRHFPKRGSIAAAQLLERRAFLHQRVLNAFNQPMRHWLDLYCFVGFVSLCARFSLETMAVGGFAPVAATADWLARRHAEHSRMGLWGLQRVVEAGAVGSPLLQRYINRWVALGLGSKAGCMNWSAPRRRKTPRGSMMMRAPAGCMKWSACWPRSTACMTTRRCASRRGPPTASSSRTARPPRTVRRWRKVPKVTRNGRSPWRNMTRRWWNSPRRTVGYCPHDWTPHWNHC
jgi:hypothetical protein